MKVALLSFRNLICWPFICYAERVLLRVISSHITLENPHHHHHQHEDHEQQIQKHLLPLLAHLSKIFSPSRK